MSQLRARKKRVASRGLKIPFRPSRGGPRRSRVRVPSPDATTGAVYLPAR